jgi:outer membrane protein assembly factor BamB
MAIVGGLLVVLVVAGIVGMNWLFQYQKMNKIAQGEAILVTMTIGDVQIKKMGSDKWKEVAVEDVVEMGDTLRTGPDSACELQIVEKGVYRLEGNTEILVSKLVNQDDALQARIHVDKGIMGLKPKKLKEGEVFEVESSTAVAAVRGTVFMVTVTEEGDTRVAVSEGKVALAPKITSLEEAKTNALLDEKAYEELKKTVAAPVEITANEEAVLPKTVVEKINDKVAEVVTTKSKEEGPLTVEKVDEVVTTVKKEFVKETGVTSPTNADANTSLVALAVEKKQITEEAKAILQKVEGKEPVSRKAVRISITTDVAGADVAVNGEIKGKTPLSVVLDGEKTYTLSIEKEGYEPLTAKLTLVKETNVAFTLKKSEVVVESNTNALIVQEAQPTNEVAVTPPQKVEKPTLKPGDMLWEKPFSEKVSGMMMVVLRGDVANDRIVSAVDNRIVIMNAAGEVIKSITVGKGTTYEFPLVTSPRAFFTRDDDGVIYCYDYSGNLRWSSKLGKTPAWVGLALTPKALLVGIVQGKVCLLNQENGETIQTIDAAGQIYSTPTMVDNRLLVYALENGTVVGYDTVENRELWKKDLGKRFVLPLSSVVVGDKRVVVLPVQGKLIGCNAERGDVLWEKDLPGVTFEVKPIVVGEVMYVINKNQVIALRMLTGNVVNKLIVNGTVVSLQIDKKTLYVLDSAGKLQALGRDGKELWSYNAGKDVQGMAVHPEGVYVFKNQSVVKLVGENKPKPAKK